MAKTSFGELELTGSLMSDKYVKLSEVMEILMSPRFQFLKGADRIEKIPPKHGLCCTCQDCGRIYEDCVCTHNELIAALQNLSAVDVISREQIQAAILEMRGQPPFGCDTWQTAMDILQAHCGVAVVPEEVRP